MCWHWSSWTAIAAAGHATTTRLYRAVALQGVDEPMRLRAVCEGALTLLCQCCHHRCMATNTNQALSCILGKHSACRHMSDETWDFVHDQVVQAASASRLLYLCKYTLPAVHYNCSRSMPYTTRSSKSMHGGTNTRAWHSQMLTGEASIVLDGDLRVVQRTQVIKAVVRLHRTVDQCTGQHMRIWLT